MPSVSVLFDNGRRVLYEDIPNQNLNAIVEQIANKGICIIKQFCVVDFSKASAVEFHDFVIETDTLCEP